MKADNIVVAKGCLTLISNIARRGAASDDPEHIGYALQELSQVLLERTGQQSRVFEPIPADEIDNLNWLHAELMFVESFTQSFTPSEYGTLN